MSAVAPRGRSRGSWGWCAAIAALAVKETYSIVFGLEF